MTSWQMPRVLGTIDPERPWYDQEIGSIDRDEFATAFRDAVRCGTGIVQDGRSVPWEDYFETEKEMTMDFGGAIAGLKAGRKVYREAWAPATAYLCLDGVDSVVIVAHGTTAIYQPDCSDMLGEDWRYFNAGLGDRPTLPDEKIENAVIVDTAEAGLRGVPVVGDPDPEDAPGS